MSSSHLFECSYMKNQRLIDIGLKSLPMELRKGLQFTYSMYDKEDTLFSFRDSRKHERFVYVYNTGSNSIPLTKQRLKIMSSQSLNVTDVPINQAIEYYH
jgi:hypothetical protein